MWKVPQTHSAHMFPFIIFSFPFPSTLTRISCSWSAINVTANLDHLLFRSHITFELTWQHQGSGRSSLPWPDCGRYRLLKCVYSGCDDIELIPAVIYFVAVSAHLLNSASFTFSLCFTAEICRFLWTGATGVRSSSLYLSRCYLCD